MNLRKKPQTASLVAGSDISNEVSKVEEPLMIDRPNRREISQAAKYLINFINDINKETREVRKRKDRKQEEEVPRQEPIKKQKVDKTVTSVTHAPKQPPKTVEKPDPMREANKTNELYRFTPKNPFALDGLDPTKKGMPIQSFPYEYILSPAQKFDGYSFFPPNFDMMGLQGIPNFQAIQGLSGMQGIPNMQGMAGIPGMMPIPGNKPTYFGYNNSSYVRLPMQFSQQPIAPTQQNINDYRNMRFNQRKIFKRGSYHVAIAYNIHIEKLKKRPEAEQIDQAYIDPTYFARKMREQNKTENREIAREQDSSSNKSF